MATKNECACSASKFIFCSCYVRVSVSVNIYSSNLDLFPFSAIKYLAIRFVEIYSNLITVSSYSISFLSACLSRKAVQNNTVN